MSTKYKLRQTAIDDLREIGKHTLENYGKTQRDKYLDGLKERFELLGNNPNFGRSRDDVKAGYRCSTFGKHIVFYTLPEGTVEIIGILHERMVPEQNV
jgi:toxin ParE1/3/4